MRVFLGYGVGQKGYCVFDPVSQKLYVYRHVVFFEHITFFSIPTSSHNVTMSDLIYIDHFTLDIDTVPLTVSQAPFLVSKNVSCRVPIDSSVDFGTLAPDTTIERYKA